MRAKEIINAPKEIYTLYFNSDMPLYEGNILNTYEEGSSLEIKLHDRKIIFYCPSLSGKRSDGLWFFSIEFFTNNDMVLLLPGQILLNSDKVYRKTVRGKLPFVKILEKITLNESQLSIVYGDNFSLVASVETSSSTKNITWSSSNPIVAHVDQKGKVMGIRPGVATITATLNNQVSASCEVNVTKKGTEVAFYESSTLKYWIVRPASNYIVTHIWVKDAYNQMKVAITTPKEAGKEYPRNLQQPDVIMKNEITNKGYSNKALVAVNGSGMIKNTNNFCASCPKEWYGTSILPLQINEGRIIRDSTESVDVQYVKNKFVYMLGKNSILTYKKFSTDLEKNKTVKKTIIESIQPKYTFGFGPILVENGEIKSGLATDKNMRQSICQIDKNNFIFITTTVPTTNRGAGLSLYQLAELMKKYGCQTGFNLDGGGSTAYHYKTNVSTLKRISTGYDGRGSSDMVYFVEQ